MAISLQKGGNVSLSKVEPGLRSVRVGLGWADGPFDIDASAFLLTAAGKVRTDADFIFYNQPSSSDGSVRHSGDNRSGVGEGDDESLLVDLSAVPAVLERIVFAVTLHEAAERGHDFSQVQQAYIRVLGSADRELARFDLGAMGRETALIVGELYRHQGEWKFRAVGQGFAGGLGPLASHFGVGVEDQSAAPPAPPPPLSVRLSKPGQRQTVSLDKPADPISITASWIDNGDEQSDNDDLDLRAGILWPDGRFEMVHCDAPGHVQRSPYLQHAGDVREATKGQPGSERMQLNAAISRLAQGPVAVVFSVYSALGNGAVSINSLQPSMRIQYGAQQVHCQLSFDGPADDPEWDGVYTYVLGMVIADGEQLQIIQGGQKSEPGSEATPLLRWTGRAEVHLSMDGPELFKDD